jgi:DNA-binding transcriptional LysR family regulator
MDTEVARTFLAVVAEGSFSSAATRLNVTQSTVSIRIRTLEDRMGRQLLSRHKYGVRMTPAGQRFFRHAAVIVRTLEQARHDVGMASTFRASLRIGARFGLWETFLEGWLNGIAGHMPNVSIRAEIGFEDELTVHLVEGLLDIGVMYTPQSRSGLVVEPLLAERLVLVSSREHDPDPLGDTYVYVDWGPDFVAHHNLTYPDYAGSQLIVNIAQLGLNYILANGGSAYLPMTRVSPLIEQGRLFRVAGAAEFLQPAFVVYPEHAAEVAEVKDAVAGLHALAAKRH